MPKLVFVGLLILARGPDFS